VDSLTDQQRSMLDTEREFWATPGRKEDAIVERFGVTPVRYYQRLNQVITEESALAYDPVTVNRLRRIRARRSVV